ncbi:hypothetical protein ACIQWR_19510 [Streptomyces sp. NPDC098789]|uniref:hypothetical protein n=1 Tax=Streptomyces sp. NPDC098789 TaxID=3366098 RepID=UPI0037F12DD7
MTRPRAHRPVPAVRGAVVEPTGPLAPDARARPPGHRPGGSVGARTGTRPTTCTIPTHTVPTHTIPTRPASTRPASTRTAPEETYP